MNVTQNLILSVAGMLIFASCATTHHAPPTAESITWLESRGTDDANLQWFDALEFGLHGQGWSETKHPYDRLPATAEGVVRGPVWGLGQRSAGLCVRFVTDSPQIKARWTLRFESLAMNHMPATGVSGLDLYVRDGDDWRWVGVGRPAAFPDNESKLVSNAPPGAHEYALFLPLYNGVDAVEIGIASETRIARSTGWDRTRPICIYGTSIVQGGCASRPGMAHTAILSRSLDRPVINLGFSGNGKMEPEVAALLAELDPAVYVIDAAPNMNALLITECTEALVSTLRQARPDTPIVLVENIVYQNGWFIDASREAYESKNAALHDVFRSLKRSRVPNIHYITCDALLGDDGEATVDGTHPSDLGFQRMADAIEPTLRRLLK